MRVTHALPFLTYVLALVLVLAPGLALAPAQAADVTPSQTAPAARLAPITANQWSTRTAAHLLERAGFGGTPTEVNRLAAMSPRDAVRSLLQPGLTRMSAFNDSGAHDPSLEPFPASRPAATELAKRTGRAMGVEVKPDGNRRLQPVADRFFYWLRASRLETHRLAYWWANRMLNSDRPLQEKMTLFWHGHFATSEEKVRDYRKLLQQNELFRAQGLGNFRTLLVAVAQDPAMLAFLDAGVNVKGAPNENFAREIMELFSMGVGHYNETDIREAARAFTGWNFADLKFVVAPEKHDDGVKTVLGKTAAFDGVSAIDHILAQPIAAEFIAAKIYHYFVRDEIAAPLQTELGALLRASKYELAPFLETLLMSRDFYSADVIGTRIKSPVELVISTYKKMGLTEVPGVPDFNEITEALGQKLFFPPTVAGWAQGRAWITPGLLLARGNFAFDTLFPDINYIASDRNPGRLFDITSISDKLSMGQDVTRATKPDAKEMSSQTMQMADRDEDFNTRLASLRGWQMATQKIKPIPRTSAALELSVMVREARCKTAQEAVDVLLGRFLSVPVSTAQRQRLASFLANELGTSDVVRAASYLEEPLRNLLHLILSMPDYQLGQLQPSVHRT
jgi:uncharacterized protein (DUF1800 family)